MSEEKSDPRIRTNQGVAKSAKVILSEQGVSKRLTYTAFGQGQAKNTTPVVALDIKQGISKPPPKTAPVNPKQKT